MQDIEGSFVGQNLQKILDSEKHWRGRSDVLQVADQKKGRKYLIKQLGILSELDKKDEFSAYMKLINVAEGEMQFISQYKETVVYNGKKYLVYEKKGTSLLKWKKKQVDLMNLSRITKILLQIINISEYLQIQTGGQWHIADQFEQGLSFENDSVFLQIPLIFINFKEYKDYIQAQYIRAQTERSLFFYPPEILGQSSYIDIEDNFQGSQKADAWAAGILLYFLKDGAINDIILLQDPKKREEILAKLKEDPFTLNDLIVNLLEHNPVKRMSLQMLKENLIEIQKISKDRELTEVPRQSQELEKQFKNKISTNKEIIMEVQNQTKDILSTDQQFFDLQIKNSNVIKLISQDMLPQKVKSEIYLAVKSYLESSMNFFLKLLIKKQTPNPSAKSDFEMLKISNKRAWLNPISISLADFLESAEQFARSIGEDIFAEQLLHTYRQIPKAFYFSKNMEKALEFAEHAFARDGNNIEAILMCAEIGFIINNSKLMEKYLSLAKTKGPNNPAVLFLSGREKNAFQRDPKSALEFFKKCFDFASADEKTDVNKDQDNFPYYPKKSNVLFELGMTYYNLDLDDLSRECYEQCALINPTHPNVYHQLGEYYFKLKNYKECQKCYENQIRVSPNLSESCLRLFDLLEAAGLQEYAIQILEHSQSENAFIRLIRVYENKGDYMNLQRVVESYEKYIKKYKDIVHNALTEGKQFLSLKKNSEQVLKVFNTILNEFQNNSYLCLKIAEIFMQQKEDHSSEIIYLLKRSISLTPEYIQSRYRLSQIYLRTGQLDLYRMELLEIVKISPHHAEALFQLGKNDLLAKSKVKPLETLKLLKSCIRCCDRIPEIYGYLGLAYYKADKFPAALRCFEISKRLKENDYESLFQFSHAKCLLFNNQPHEANILFQKLISLSTLKKNSIFNYYSGICLFYLKDGKCASPLIECQDTLAKVKMRTSAIKLILQDLLNQMNNSELISFKQKTVKILTETTDSDLCAILSESILVSRSFPQTAMHYVEKGLGQVHLFNPNEKEDTILSPEVENHFGCRIQKAKIDFKIGRDPAGLIKELLEIKSAMVKADKTIKSDLKQESAKEKKSRIKYPLLNWHTCLDMLLVELFIAKGDELRGNNIIKKEIVYRDNLKFERERAHWHAVMTQDYYQQLKNLKANKNYPPSCYYLGMKYKQSGQKIEAFTALKKSMLNNTRNALYCKSVADCLYDSGQRSASKQYYFSYYYQIQAENNLLQIHEKQRPGKTPRIILFESESLTRLGEILQQQKKIKDALKVLKKSLDIDNNQPQAMFCYAKCLIEKKEFQEARSILDKLIVKETHNLEIIFLLAECHISLGDFENGKELFQKIEKKDPNNYGMLRGLGECYLKDNDLQQASNYFDKCVTIDPKDWRVLCGLSSIFLAKGQLDKAQEYLKKALELNSGNESIFNKLIQFYQEASIIPDESYISKFFNVFEKNKSILSYLGETYFQASKTNSVNLDKSFKYYQSRIKLSESPGDDQYLALLANLRLAQISFFQKKFPASLQLIQHFVIPNLPLDSTPEKVALNNVLQFDFYLLKAKLFLQLGRPQVPQQLLKCIKINAEDDRSYFVFAEYLLQKGSQDAWRYFQKGMGLVKDRSQKREDILILQSLFALKDKNINDSKKILKECISAFNSSEVAYYYFGNLLFEEQNYDSVQLIYEDALNLQAIVLLPMAACLVLSKEQQQILFYQLAVSQAKTDQKKKAQQTCKKYLSFYPSDLKILELLSQLQFEEGCSEEAFQSAQQLVSLGSTDVQTYHILAQVSLRLSNTYQAIFALHRCLNIQPNYGQTQLKIGLIYQSIARPKEALSYFLQFLAYFPNSLQALLRSSKLLAYFQSYISAQSHIDRLFHELKKRNESETNKQIHFHNKTSSNYLLIEDKTLLEDQYIELSDAYAVQGYLFLQQNYLTQALVSYEDAFSHNKDNKSIQESIAIIHRKTQNYKAEIKIYKSLLKSEKSSEEALKMTINLGVAYKNANKLKKAISVCEKAKLQYFQENSVILYANLGVFYLESKSYDEAIFALNQALDNERNHTESNYLLGMAYENKGDINTGVRFYERSIKSNIYFFQAYLSLSAIKEKQGKIQEAIQICQSALEHCSSNKETILLKLGDLQMKSKDLWAALATLEQVLSSNNVQDEYSKDKKARQIQITCNIQIARVYRQLQEDEKSINHLKICLVNSPEQPEYLHELGLIMFHKKNYIEALNLFKQAACANPINATYVFNVATVLHHLHQFQLEIESLNECLALNPSFNQNIYNNIALAYVQLNNTEKAIEIFKKSIKKYPQDINLMYNLGNLYYSSKKLRQAVEMYQSCLKIDPMHIGALNNLAVIYVLLTEFQSAVECFSQCLIIHPEKKQIYFQKIMILQQKGYYPKQN